MKLCILCILKSFEDLKKSSMQEAGEAAQAGMHEALVPPSAPQKPEEREFKVSLGCITSSNPAWAT